MNREKLKYIAEQTVEALHAGFYRAGGATNGKPIPIRVPRSTLYTPEMLDELRVKELPGEKSVEVKVTTETTLSACAREAGAHTLALNFASGTRPGGGFLTGAQAQEESLARASALYTSLTAHPTYYAENKRAGAPLYTDHMILSSSVPVFRDDAGNWLPEPYEVSFLTVPAPNCSSGTDPHDPQIIETIQRRALNICALARAEGFKKLVLGAWGCGVFANDSEVVALAFREALRQYPCEQVTFAIYGGEFLTTEVFRQVLQ